MRSPPISPDLQVAEYKLCREKPSSKDREAAASRQPGRPFAVSDPDRSIYQVNAC